MLTASKGQDVERHGDGAGAGGTRRWVSGRVKDGTKRALSLAPGLSTPITEMVS